LREGSGCNKSKRNERGKEHGTEVTGILVWFGLTGRGLTGPGGLYFSRQWGTETKDKHRRGRSIVPASLSGARRIEDRRKGALNISCQGAKGGGGELALIVEIDEKEQDQELATLCTTPCKGWEKRATKDFLGRDPKGKGGGKERSG